MSSHVLYPNDTPAERPHVTSQKRLSPSHPDPSGAQLLVLREALQRIVTGHLKAMELSEKMKVGKSIVKAS